MSDAGDLLWHYISKKTASIHNSATKEAPESNLTQYGSCYSMTYFVVCYYDYIMRDKYAMRRGRYFEPFILEWTCRILGLMMALAPMISDTDDPEQTETTDALGFRRSVPLPIMMEPFRPMPHRCAMRIIDKAPAMTTYCIEAKMVEYMAREPHLYYVVQNLKQQRIQRVKWGIISMWSADGGRRAWLVVYDKLVDDWIRKRAQTTRQHMRAGDIMEANSYNMMHPCQVFPVINKAYKDGFKPLLLKCWCQSSADGLNHRHRQYHRDYMFPKIVQLYNISTGKPVDPVPEDWRG